MLDAEIRRKIRQLEITTRRLLTGAQSGETRSRRKGSGFEFDQIRSYYQGDDVRFIDWRASARHNKLLVKEYIEERNRTIIIAVDCSASLDFTSGEQRIAERAAQIASVLALVAGYGCDAVSLVLFTDQIEKVVPIGRGQRHAHHIMETVFSFTPQHTKTDLSSILAYAARKKRSDSVLIIISDFIDEHFSRYLPSVARAYDTIAIRCYDKRASEIPAVGLLPVMDMETGVMTTLDMRGRRHEKNQQLLHYQRSSLNSLFKKHGVAMLDIDNSAPFMGDVIRFFRRRMSY